jgi:GT2 family glycosyltransferase/SAM-dependent methyltransferase
MNFSIIIPTFKAFAELNLCLQSLSNNSSLKNEILIFVDPLPNGEYSQEIIELCKVFPHIQLFKNKRILGPYGSWNKGARIAQNEYLCFLTDDQYMAPEWDYRITKYLTDSNILTSQLVESGIIRPYHSNLIRNFGYRAEDFDENGFLQYVKLHAEDRIAIDGFFIPTIIHRNLFRSLGGWPTEKPFPYSNDTLFKNKLWSKGLDYQRVLNSFSYHFQNSSISDKADKNGLYFDAREKIKIINPTLQERIKRRLKYEIKKQVRNLFGIQVIKKVRVTGYSKPKKSDMKLAYKYCIGKGVEIGPGSNRFPNIQTVTVDFVDEFKNRIYPKPDYIGTAYDLHYFNDKSRDFVINSHLLEHLLNPIRAIKEWMRILRHGGHLLMIIPDKNLIPHKFDNKAEETPLRDLILRYEQNLTETLDDNPKTSCLGNPENAEFDPRGKPGWRHYNYWTSKSIVEFLVYLGLEVVEVVEAKEKNTGMDVYRYSWDDFTVVAKVKK